MKKLNRVLLKYEALHKFGDETANIKNKNCSLTIVLMATVEEQQKSLKR